MEKISDSMRMLQNLFSFMKGNFYKNTKITFIKSFQ